MAHVSLRLPPSLLEQVEALALHHRCRPANVLRHALEVSIPAMVERLPPPPPRF